MAVTIDIERLRVEEEAQALPWARFGAAFGIFGIFFAPVFFWFGKVRAAQLRGHSIEVGPNSYRIVHERLQAACEAMGATDLDIRVYVVSSGDYNLQMERFGSRRIIVLNGRLLEDLGDPHARQELDFLIGRFVGAFVLRHLRFGLFHSLIAARKIPVVGLLLSPWYRATVYSGDRIGREWCGSAEAAMSAMAKLTVGPEAYSEYSLDGHLEQARRVQHDLFHRLYRWRSDYPHMSDRVLRLATETVGSTGSHDDSESQVWPPPPLSTS